MRTKQVTFFCFINRMKTTWGNIDDSQEATFKQVVLAGKFLQCTTVPFVSGGLERNMSVMLKTIKYELLSFLEMGGDVLLNKISSNTQF